MKGMVATSSGRRYRQIIVPPAAECFCSDTRSLAEQALAAWEREEDESPLPTETREQQTARHRAGSLGLIGLSIQESGIWEGDEVVVSLDASYIGDAFRPADDAGLLQGLSG